MTEKEFRWLSRKSVVGIFRPGNDSKHVFLCRFLDVPVGFQTLSHPHRDIVSVDAFQSVEKTVHISLPTWENSCELSPALSESNSFP